MDTLPFAKPNSTNQMKKEGELMERGRLVIGQRKIRMQRQSRRRSILLRKITISESTYLPKQNILTSDRIYNMKSNLYMCIYRD